MWGGSHSAISAEDLKALFFFSPYTQSPLFFVSLTLMCLPLFLSFLSINLSAWQTKWRQQEKQKALRCPGLKTTVTSPSLAQHPIHFYTHTYSLFQTVFNIFLQMSFLSVVNPIQWCRTHIKKTQHSITFYPQQIHLPLQTHSFCPKQPYQPCRQVCSSSLKPFLLLAYVPEGTLYQ